MKGHCDVGDSVAAGLSGMRGYWKKWRERLAAVADAMASGVLSAEEIQAAGVTDGDGR